MSKKSFVLSDSSDYSFEYSYDNTSKLKQKRTPSGNTFSYSYKNNKLITIRLNDSTEVWGLKQVDAYGNMLEFVLGNGVITNQKYDHLTQRLKEINSGTFRWSDWIKFSNSKRISEENGLSYLVPINRLENWKTDEGKNQNQSILEERSESYDPFNIQKLSLEYDKIGNLRKRSDFVNNILESFEYDELNRIERYDKLSGKDYYRENFDYDEIGDIVSRSSLGNYDYSTDNPYKLVEVRGSDRKRRIKLKYHYNEWGEMEHEKKENLKISYNTFGKVSTISKDGLKASIEYDLDLNPFKRTYFDKEEVNYQTISLEDDFEINLNMGVRSYVDKVIIGGRLIATFETNPETTSHSSKYYHHDHLGSIVATTSSTGKIISRTHYDPFGNPTILVGNQSTGEVNGFTGHKLMSEWGLIITANRIYDPRLGRFLSKDPIIQHPSSLKTYNPYSYVGNNPLSYIDPDGLGLLDFLKPVTEIIGETLELAVRPLGLGNEFEAFWDKNGTQIVVAAIAIAAGYYAGMYAGTLAEGTSWAGVAKGAAAGAASNATTVALNGGDFQDILKASFKGSVIGAVSRAMFGKIGDNTAQDPDLFSAKYFGKTVAHGTAGGIQSELSGGNFGDGFVSASIANAVSPGIRDLQGSWSRIAASSVVGGTVNLITGRDVFMGATNAMFSRWFNHERHRNKYGLDLKPRFEGPTLGQANLRNSRYMSESEMRSYSPEYRLHHAYTKGTIILFIGIMQMGNPYMWMLRNLKSDTRQDEVK